MAEEPKRRKVGKGVEESSSSSVTAVGNSGTNFESRVKALV